jgi:uncharacterized protein YjiK
MKSWIRRSVSVAAVLMVAACDRPDDDGGLVLLQTPEAQARAARFESMLAAHRENPDDTTAVARWFLPESLAEVSGLALAADERLFLHSDEGGLVAVMDYRSGVLFKEFIVGAKLGAVDFEGITVADNKLFMVDSDGILYEFREGRAGEHVEYAIHATNLEKECEFEGVAYSTAIQSLLLSCKNIRNDLMKDSLVIFRWKLEEGAPLEARLSRMTIPLANVTAPIQSETFRPSDITVDPSTGNYVLVASQEKAILEMTPAGDVIEVRRIADEHEQAEGVAITKDGILIISNEAVRGKASITLYRKR